MPRWYQYPRRNRSPPLFRLLKTTASGVLASLNASTYWEVRLDITLATALLEGHFEQPARIRQALPFQSSVFIDAHDTAHVKGMPAVQRLKRRLRALKAGNLRKHNRDKGKGETEQ